MVVCANNNAIEMEADNTSCSCILVQAVEDLGTMPSETIINSS